MAQITFSVRMEEGLKRQFDSLCSDFGMNTSTAITIFAKKVVQEERIPFEISAVSHKKIREDGKDAFYKLRQQALKQYPNGLSLDEINEIIDKTRKGEE